MKHKWRFTESKLQNAHLIRFYVTVKKIYSLFFITKNIIHLLSIKLHYHISKFKYLCNPVTTPVSTPIHIQSKLFLTQPNA